MDVKAETKVFTVNKGRKILNVTTEIVRNEMYMGFVVNAFSLDLCFSVGDIELDGAFPACLYAIIQKRLIDHVGGLS
ncbi:MAG: hypothetical protein KQI81_08905 [Deltaproteobacteria bacterium]|nr:hypothetical protein [Deltaproteobacteria bacterium]